MSAKEIPNEGKIEGIFSQDIEMPEADGEVELAATVFAMELAAQGEVVAFDLRKAIEETKLEEETPVVERGVSKLRKKLKEIVKHTDEPAYTQGQTDFFKIREGEELEEVRRKEKNSEKQKELQKGKGISPSNLEARKRLHTPDY